MRASTQYSNTQKRGAKPASDDRTPVDQVPQQELVLRHADLVKRIAYHLVSRMPPNVEVDDLIQSGMIGLLDAAKHYSATKGANFETYAGIRIRGAMLDEVRKSDWTPRSVHRNMREMADVIRKIENAKGQDATPPDIAEGLGVSIEEYHTRRVAGYLVSIRWDRARTNQVPPIMRATMDRGPWRISRMPDFAAH